MQIKAITGLFLLLILNIACQEESVQVFDVNVIPNPNEVKIGLDYFVINEETGMSSDPEFQISATFLKDFIKHGSGIDLNSGDAIKFIKDQSLPQEGYVLDITESYIHINASTDQGAFYAIQSLRQLMPIALEKGDPTIKEIKIGCVTIKDQPQFQYRGMHLDVGRHMFSVDFIKKYIDALAMLKMNTFHWHLTEDQGWRIEIKKYPNLQKAAAYRKETLVGHYSDQPHQFDGKKYGGYYTQKQIKELVAYAQKRFVTIIPEIEMPGHSQAAIAAYPELGCKGESVEVATKWGVFEDIYCTKDETFAFLENVLDEVLELFPSTYIHIGGDEAPKTRWKSCADCQARIESEGLEDENQLQSYFIQRIEKHLNSKGRQIIGWDEILEGGLAANATVMSWRGMDGAIEAAKAGHNVVMTPTSHCYFDYYQSENEDEPIAIGGYLPLEKVYDFNPIPKELSNEEAIYVLGSQGNIWTEYMPTEDKVEYMAFPRILAMSEVVWSTNKDKNYKDFVRRLEYFHKRLDALDINYANHLYDIKGQVLTEDRKVYLHLETLTSDKTIRYTTDGSEPKPTDSIYMGKIPIYESGTIMAAVFKDQEKLGKVFSEDITMHKAVGARISLDKNPHEAYSGSGKEGLINGVSGSEKRYGDKEWLGFSGEDIAITIDFGKKISINSVETRFHNGNGQWIYAPKTVMMQVDHEPDSLRIDIQATDDLLIPVKFNIPVQARHITLFVPNYGIIPEGKQGAGHKAWTFIDEIVVN